jgi:hypothetical protein
MSAATTSRLDLPEDVRSVLHHFLTAEVTTVGKDGTPITWPVCVQFREDRGDFLLSTSIGYPGKVFNLRRDNRISLSYSEPTGSGLDNPPHVVVQGRATVEDEVTTDVMAYDDYWVENVMGPQPQSKLMSSNPIMRWYMDVYYMRLIIRVDPVRISWWPQGDHSRDVQSIEVTSNVG